MKKFVLGLALGLIAGPALADPLIASIEAEGGMICFTRLYDSAWLKAHPGQTVREVKLAISDPSRTEMRLSLTGPSQSLFGFGECVWAGRGVNREALNILEPRFKATVGVLCHMSSDITGGSAEEGASFPIDWRDGRTIQIYLPDALAGWTSYDISRRANWHDIKPADRIIRLNRAKPSACRSLVDKFAPNGFE